MTRRNFFGALTLGGATVPAALKVVSTPPAWLSGGTLTIPAGATVSNAFLRCSRLVMGAGSRLMNSDVRAPWWRPGIYIDGGPSLIIRNTFTSYEPPPFWARALRLGGKYTT